MIWFTDGEDRDAAGDVRNGGGAAARSGDRRRPECGRPELGRSAAAGEKRSGARQHARPDRGGRCGAGDRRRRGGRPAGGGCRPAVGRPAPGATPRTPPDSRLPVLRGWDAQMREMAGQLGPAKGKDFDTGNVLGPWIVTADELGDPHKLTMVARVNGEEWSRGTSAAMHRWPSWPASPPPTRRAAPGFPFGPGAPAWSAGPPAWSAMPGPPSRPEADSAAEFVGAMGVMKVSPMGCGCRPPASAFCQICPMGEGRRAGHSRTTVTFRPARLAA